MTTAELVELVEKMEVPDLANREDWMALCSVLNEDEFEMCVQNAIE
jgi:hypothetical protein